MTSMRSPGRWNGCSPTSSCGSTSAQRASAAPPTSHGPGRPSRHWKSCAGSETQPSVKSRKWYVLGSAGQDAATRVKERISVLALLAGNQHDYLHMARPLLRALEATQHFTVEVVTDARKLPLRNAKVLLAASDHALQPGEAAQLTDFVRSGGGLVVLHG